MVANSTLTAQESKSCGPPNYCARSDRRIEAYPQAPVAIGPSGSIVTDPNFGSRIVRVTDTKSDTQGRGRSFMTPSSAEQNPWNADGTKFYVMTMGGQFVLYDFDPSSLKIHQRGVVKTPWQGEPQFSYLRPNILYGVRANYPVFQEYNTTDGMINALHKISDCVRVNASDYGHTITVSADDSRMITSIGPRQDRDSLIYVFDRKLGCRWYNTRTGEIGGQWGPKGNIVIPDRCWIHNARLSKSGQYVWIQRGGGDGVGKGWLVWDVATMQVAACSFQCGGHHAMGYSHIVGSSGDRHPLDLILRPLGDLSTITHLISDLQPTSSARYWYDQHYSWNNVEAGDANPVCFSTYSTNNTSTPGVPLDTIAPWENEILCAETDGKASTVWRFAHTYSTAKNGFWSTPRGNVSQDGRFFIFTSDWLNQLGEEPSNRNNHRTDVFIVELR